MRFEDLRLAEPILRAVAAEGYSTPTPIQSKAIPHVLEGHDLMGCAQTGTGKTAAFALPILHRLSHRHPPRPGTNGTTSGHVPHAHGRAEGRHPRCLVLSPTRELAVQIGDSFRVYGKHTGLKQTVIFGGVGQGAQVAALRHGVDILVATPGRLLDLMNQGYVDLSRIEVFVLDEADRMLDMGFIADIRKIVSRIPRHRQTLMFSATMPRDIRHLADSILQNPVSVEVTPVSSTVETVEQSVYFVDRRNKPALLTHVLKSAPQDHLTLVFTRTKHGADRVVKELAQVGIRSEAIHGNKRQNVRQRALEKFRTGHTPVLVATDIAARGIDIDDIALVVNYDVPNVPETYVHRIGRTARAGASGRTTSFCDHEERAYVRDIEKLIKRTIPVRDDHPAFAAHAPSSHSHHRPRESHGRGSGGHGRGQSGSGRPHRQASAPSHGGGHPSHTPHPTSHRGQHVGAGAGSGGHPRTGSDAPQSGHSQSGSGHSPNGSHPRKGSMGKSWTRGVRTSRGKRIGR